MVHSFVEEGPEKDYIQISWQQAFKVESLSQISSLRERLVANQVSEGNLLLYAPAQIYVQENDPEYQCEIVPLEKVRWMIGEGLQVLEEVEDGE